VLEST